MISHIIKRVQRKDIRREINRLLQPAGLAILIDEIPSTRPYTSPSGRKGVTETFCVYVGETRSSEMEHKGYLVRNVVKGRPQDYSFTMTRTFPNC